MKTSGQERRALEQRRENELARARSEPLPFPNVWDTFITKPSPTASREEVLAWHRRFADAHEPKRFRDHEHREERGGTNHAGRRR